MNAASMREDVQDAIARVDRERLWRRHAEMARIGAIPGNGVDRAAKVPFILSVELNEEYQRKAGAATLKSYQIFEYALNGAA